jgi:hypothetical protein
MDQADWKLKIFYQHQIAKIAKLSREQCHPAARKRLKFLVNQYIDMLLTLPRQSERDNVETRMQPVLFVTRRPKRRVGTINQSGGQEPRRRLGGDG